MQLVVMIRKWLTKWYMRMYIAVPPSQNQGFNQSKVVSNRLSLMMAEEAK